MNTPIKQKSSADAGYEKRDIRFRIMAAAFGGLFLLWIVVYMASKVVLHVLTDRPSAKFSEDMRASDKLPPEPRLQSDETRDLQNLRQEETDALNNYGWVDQKKGIVHIPIERAIGLLLQKGVPTRPTEPVKKP